MRAQWLMGPYGGPVRNIQKLGFAAGRLTIWLRFIAELVVPNFNYHPTHDIRATYVRYYADPSAAARFATDLLVKAGVSTEDSKIMADCLVMADVRGVDTHGLARLPQYLDRVRNGRVKAKPEFKLTEKTPAVAHMDGDNGFGFVVATKAMTEAIKRAESYGIGMVTVNHSNHFGMAATYVIQALEKDMISLVFTNSAKQMPPFGGKENLLGISPFAAGAPSRTEVPYILDMAPSVVAKGKIRRAARRGEPIPEGWAFGPDGKPTTDANVALNGSMAPIGGPKGSGLAILMDIMSGVLSGAAFGGEIGDQYKDPRPQNVGHCFIAIKPDIFLTTAEFKARMDILAQRVHQVPPAPGFNEVLFPGEPEHRMSIQRRKEGIPYAEAERKMFSEAAEQFSVSEIPLSETPLSLS
ncbi:L-sulfolactate dehydrogenase [Aspergillus lentulus]|uniref:Ldh family oxidoreductase n=1 Tax=Aspergillus lentulus TaxID=293939 RepID=UPI001392755E|nr:L-sulfolactate dehydrogenase [Aspergillus lentulus]GFF54733.1 L-sulfolactate dehydrogenase [Aspergillus lentulus]